MIILPFFPKRGCWNLSKSHLLSIRISRIKVLKSGNYSQKKIKLNVRRPTEGVNYYGKTCTWWRVDFLVTR